MSNNEKIIKIAWHGKHFGEEPPLVGNKDQGAGAIFFSGCNLRCVFCQNYQISHEKIGKKYSVDELSQIMLELQKQGAINIDLVSPIIWWKQIKEAIIIARANGLNIPILWNSNAYGSKMIIDEMTGYVDIYLPDFKYSDEKLALKYSGVTNYPYIAERSIEIAHGILGNLKIEDGIAKSGIIVRHLVLPGNLENTFGVLEKIASVDKNIHVSLMSQYSPLFDAKNYPEINRALYESEFDKAYEKLVELGLLNGWVQELESVETLIPDFKKEKPFL